MTTITCDGVVPDLEEVDKDELVDGFLLLAVVVKVVVVFNLLVVNVVDDLSQCTPCCRCSSRCCCSILLCRGCCQRRCCGTIFVSELLLNNSLSTMLCLMLSCLLFCLMSRTMLSLNSSKAILLMSGLVVEPVVVHILVANFLSRSSSLMLLIFPMFCWTLRTLSVLSTSLSILLLSGLVVHSVVLHILVANLLLNNFSSHHVVVVAVGSSNP